MVNFESGPLKICITLASLLTNSLAEPTPATFTNKGNITYEAFRKLQGQTYCNVV